MKQSFEELSISYFTKPYHPIRRPRLAIIGGQRLAKFLSGKESRAYFLFL